LLIDSLAKEERYADAAGYQVIFNRRNNTFEGWRDLAYYYEQSRRFSEAVPVLRNLVAWAPDHPDLRRRLGNALEQIGQIEDAMAVYRDLLARSPDDEGAVKAIGRILYRQKKYSESIQMLASARKLDPFDIDLLRLEGMAREMINDVDGALSTYAEAIRLDSNLQASDVSRYLALAKKHGRLGVAVETLRGLLHSKNMDSRRVLVMALGERLTLDGDLDAAIRLYESVLDSLGEFPPPILSLGDLYLQKGDYEKATNTFLRAAAWFTDAKIPLYAATKLHAAGALRQARALYDYAFSRDSDNITASLALAEILLLLNDDLELVNVYLNYAYRLPKNEAQKAKLQFMMIIWGMRDGRPDYYKPMLKFVMDSAGKGPEIKLDLGVWKQWAQRSFTGADAVLANDLIAFREGSMTAAAFRSAHPM
jgi:tetratricopeptide (TPR) repeat protein